MAVTSMQKRTTVRAHNPGGLKLRAVRTAFRVLERVAPSLGGRWAARIWCTLPAKVTRNGGRRRDERPGPGERSTVVLDDGRRIAVETWGSGPTVYLVHGWGGWRGQLGAFVAPLTEAGRTVVAFDAPSHGESSPGMLGRRRATGAEFVEALTAVASVHGKPDAVVAHSLGCVATALAVRDGLPANRLVMVAPSARITASIALMATTLGFGVRVRERMFARLERIAHRPLSDFDVVDLGLHAPMPSTLVVHDRNDKEVAYDDGAELAATWPEAELATTEGLGHQRILRDRGVVATVVDYVTR